MRECSNVKEIKSKGRGIFLGRTNFYVSGGYIPEIIPKTLNPFGPNKHLVSVPTCCLWVHLLK